MLNQSDLEQLEKLLDRKLEEKLEEKLKPIKRQLRQLRKDQRVMLRLLDKEQMDQRKRIVRIEEHLRFHV